MNQRKLKIFYEVATELNMSKVAEKMFISQPAISQTIQELEDYLEVKLFDRIGKKLYLTSEGELFYSYTRRILNIYEEAIKTMKDIKNLEKGSLRIGASTTIGIYILPEIIGNFTKKYPNIDVSLIIENTQNISELLLHNKLDFAFVEGPVYSDELITKVFWKDELVFIAPPEHPLVQDKKNLLYAKDIENEKLIMRELGSGTRDILQRKLDNQNIVYSIYLELGNTEAIKKAVEASLGISCISKLCIKNEVKFNMLASFNLQDLLLERTLDIVYHRDKYISKTITAFIDFATTYK